MAKTPTEILREEHRVILRALAALEAAAARVAAGSAVPDGWWAEVIRWLRTFADKNHHAKEENSLFPAMIKAGVPSGGGPIEVMLAEHVQGRALIRAMESEAGAPRAAAARRYVDLLRQHIDKENGILFPLADAVLEPPTQAGVQREFDAVGVEMGREGSIPDAEAAIERLAAAL